MRLIIDLQGAQTSGSRHRGIGRYSLSLTKAMLQQSRGDEIFVLLNGEFADSLDEIRTALADTISSDQLRVWFPPKLAGKGHAIGEAQVGLLNAYRNAFIAELDPDWVLVTSLFEGYGDNAVTEINRNRFPWRTAVILYDLIPFIYQSIYLGNEGIRSWYYKKIDQLRRADLLLSISASSGMEAIDLLNFTQSSVVNISTACDSQFKPITASTEHRAEIEFRYGIGRAYVLYTGGIDYRKNIERLLEAFAILPDTLRKRYQLVVVCSIQDAERRRLQEIAAEFGMAQDELILTGFVSDRDLVYLYNSATLVVFPSWHEGFGLPALEAMQCGKPVLGSNCSSIPEVIGFDEALFDPYDVSDMADKMAFALQNPLFLDRLAAHCAKQATRFSWQVTAKRAWQALAEYQGETALLAQPLLSYRPRLAYVSPLPPERSGIADYSADLLRELTRWYDIDVVVRDPEAPNSDYVKAVCKIRSVDQFRSSANTYDRIIYHFGNSEFHAHMFELLESFPGVVVLHDFYLSGIQAWSELTGIRPFSFSRSLFLSHGFSAVLRRFQADDIHEVISEYPASLDVLQNALSVIVHSRHVRELFKKWYPDNSICSTELIPLIKPIHSRGNCRVEARKSLGISESALLFCSFGLLGQTKLNDRLIRSWQLSNLNHQDDALLIFVGEPSGVFGETILSMAAQSPNIRITGWVNDEAYQKWLAAADVGVQLRTNSRGETSAAVLDCLAAGLATIVNAHGSLGELDPECAWVLPDAFADSELTLAMEALANDPVHRRRLGACAQAVIRSKHNPRHCAAQYATAIEVAYAKQNSKGWGLLKQIGETNSLSREHLAAFSANHPPHPRRRQILLDVSGLIYHRPDQDDPDDLEALLKAVVTAESSDYQIEAIACVPGHQPGFHYARQFICDLLNIPSDWAEDEPVECWHGDIFIGLSHDADEILKRADVWNEWRVRGVHMAFLIHSIRKSMLPLSDETPGQPFTDGLMAIPLLADTLISPSPREHESLRRWFDTVRPQRERPVALTVLGAESSPASPDVPSANDARISWIKTAALLNPKIVINQLLAATVGSSQGYLWRFESDQVYRYLGDDPRLTYGVGQRLGTSVKTIGQSGFLMWGPYLSLPQGKFRLSVCGEAKSWGDAVELQVVHEQGNTQIAACNLEDTETGLWERSIDFEINSSCDDLEIRISVSAHTSLRIDGYEISTISCS